VPNLNLNLDKEFFGKKIIITGASYGLGAMACKFFSERDAKIAMLSRSKKKMDTIKSKMKNPTNHISIKVDLLKNNDVEKAFKKAKKFLKNIDIILHVAGGGFGLKENLIKNNDLKTLFQINVGAPAEINRLVIKSKSRNKILNLVHVGSVTSREAVGSVGYNTAKSALAAYVKSLGRVVYKNNVIATGILPGGFIAPGNSMDKFKKRNLKDYNKFIQTRIPRGVMGSANDILPMLLFLCSRHSSMMGGCLVPIDGGEGKAY